MKKQISFLLISSLIFSFLINPGISLAQQSVSSDFNPNNLIDDSVFSNTKTFTSANQIQSFLENQNSILANTSNVFIAQLKEPTDSNLKQTLEDPNPTSTTKRTAAQLIYDAAQSSGLNPQVILVTLNKEQSLITGRQNSTPDQIQRALDFAMGFGCPDSQPCGQVYQGFYAQLFGGLDTGANRYLGAAKSLMKSFTTPGGRGPYFNGQTSGTGDAITLPNTTGDYVGVLPQQSVVLSNAATAALYRYTPHVFNGNYNFWKFFNEWFGNPSSGGGGGGTAQSGDIIKTSGISDTYIIKDGGRYKLLQFVANLKQLDINNAKKISRTQFDSYPDKGLYPVPDNSLIKVSTKYYVFISNQKREITADTIKTLGINVDNAPSVNSSESNQYDTGPNYIPVLTVPAATPPPSPTPTPTPTTPPPTPTPSNAQEGAVLKGSSKPDVYLVTGGKLKLFTYATFVQYDALKSMKIVSDATIANLPKDGLVLPKPGSLVKSFKSPTVYFYEDGKKKPMDAEIFRNRGFSFTNVYELDQAEIDNLPLGPFPTPVDQTYFKDKKTGQLYLYRDGKKSSISAFVANQKKITPDFTFGEDSINNMPDGVPVMPKEGTIFKSDKNPTVYIINSGLAFPMTGDAFKSRGITEAQVNIFPQNEVDGYPKGSLLTK